MEPTGHSFSGDLPESLTLLKSEEVRILVNGDPVGTVAASDRGLQYGESVFTTLRVSEGVPLFEEAHLARLSRDAAQIRLPPPDLEGFRCDLRALISECSEGILKLQWTRGAGGRGYRPPGVSTPTRISSARITDPLPTASPRPWSVRLATQRLALQPALAGAKHGNRLEQILARMEWEDAQIDEALMLDMEGFLVEGTMTNLFLFEDGQLKTPALDRCGVRGVLRDVLMASARDHGIPVVEQRLRPEALYRAQDVLLTNSVIGVCGVCALEGTPLTDSGLGEKAHAWYLQAAAQCRVRWT